MNEITKIDEIGLSKFNNAEYTFFSSSVARLIDVAGTFAESFAGI